MIRAVIFDMDGLMIDSEKLYHKAETTLARSFGKSFSLPLMQQMMGRKAEESMEIFKASLGLQESAQELLARRNQLYGDLLRKEVEPMPGLFPLLSRLRENGYRLAVATSSTRHFLDLTLDRLGIRPCFEALVTGDEVERGKPHPEIYHRIRKKLDLSAHHCVVLEDTEVGVVAAKEAGMRCIAIPHQFSQDQDFSRADRVVRSLHDVDVDLLVELSRKRSEAL